MKNAVRRRSGGPSYPWYDSVWLQSYQRAKAIIAQVRPAALADFEDRLHVLRTRMDFHETVLPRVFDDEVLAAIRSTVGSLQLTDLEMHEVREFGRFIIRDHPSFAGLHQQILPLVSQLAGEDIEPTYTFLALYSAKGVCDVHMDSLRAKWTLDLCLNQSGPWPIHVSTVQPWPEAGPQEGESHHPEDWAARIKHSPSVRFTEYTLQPGQAVLFSGSSQWHYRDPIPKSGGREFCDLLLFHFCPKGLGEWVRPQHWARLFGMPELSEVEPD